MEKSHDKDKIIPDKIRGMLAGVSSGLAKCIVGHPLDTIKVRLQSEGSYGRFKGPIDCLWQTFKYEGFRGLYKGALLPLFAWSTIDTVMIGVYSASRRYAQQNILHDTTHDLPMQYVMACAMIGGWSSSFVACPVEQIKARLQVQYHEKSTQIYKGPLDCGKQLIKNNGFLGLYQGFSGTFYFRTFVSIYFTSYEYYKRQLTKLQKIPDYLVNFICGGLAATTLWLVALPLDCVKNKLMSQPDVAEKKYSGFWDCAKKTFKKEGVKGFYQGLSPVLLRSFPTNGSAFLAIELTLKYLP